jgi:hypothetical protein
MTALPSYTHIFRNRGAHFVQEIIRKKHNEIQKGEKKMRDKEFLAWMPADDDCSIIFMLIFHVSFLFTSLIKPRYSDTYHKRPNRNSVLNQLSNCSPAYFRTLIAGCSFFQTHHRIRRYKWDCIRTYTYIRQSWVEKRKKRLRRNDRAVTGHHISPCEGIINH